MRDLRQQALHELRQLDLPELDLGAALPGSHQGQEVPDGVAHLHHPGLHRGQGLAVVARRPLAAQRDLHLAADRGEGAPQLVGGGGGEATVGLEGGLKAFEHGVEPVRHAADLVVAPRGGRGGPEGRRRQWRRRGS